MQHETFKFEKRDIVGYLINDLRLLSKLKTSFKFVSERLTPQAVVADLADLNWFETKNYDWCVIQDGGVTLIIRKYRTHFTIYGKNVEVREYTKGGSYERKTYSAFTFLSDFDKMADDDNDVYVDDNFADLNAYITRLIEVVRKDDVHWLSNSAYIDTPKHLDIKPIYYGEEVVSLDQMVFCCEELFGIYFDLFCQTEMLEKLKDFKEGDAFGKDFYGEVKIHKVYAELKDEYYHGVGIETINTKGEKKFNDVYSLCRWYYNDVFPTTKEA